MRVFKHFLTNARVILPTILLAVVLYGFPSCCDDDSGTNIVEVPCEEIIEEDGMIFQKHLDDYHPWAIKIEYATYNRVYDLTAPTFLPPNNLPEEFRVDSLRIHIKAIKARVPEGVRLWAEPFIILEIYQL